MLNTGTMYISQIKLFIVNVKAKGLQKQDEIELRFADANYGFNY